jgi:hypothetical protein
MEYQSESTEGFYIDDFNGLKWLPLDSYREELESFDPRDDGYGEKLKNFFLVEGNRRFFVPLEDTGNQRGIAKNFKVALGDIPFSLEILGNPRPILVYFIMMGCACIVALVLSRDKWLFALEIPILLAFSWAGVSGFILAGFLAGLRGLLREPLGEFFPIKSFGPLGDRLKPYRSNFLMGFFFLILYGALIRVNALPLEPGLAGLAALFVLGLFALSDKRRRMKAASHARFMPVPIILKFAKPPAFQPSIMAFAGAAILALAYPVFFSGPPAKDAAYTNLSNLVLPGDYENHMAFEASFSILPLNRSEPEGYFSYKLGDDGLIANATAGTPTGMQGGALQGEVPFPAYPLEKLTGFLLHFDNKAPYVPGAHLKDWISVFLIMIASFPIRFPKEKQEGKKKKPSLFRDRRIAA